MDRIGNMAEFLIENKKNGQFRTFWDGFQNGVDLLASGEVLMSSTWEAIAIVAGRNIGDKGDIRYGTMKEGHQVWNNIVMLTRGGRERGQDDAYYGLANVYLSPWFGARTLAGLGFAPQMTGVDAYVRDNPDVFKEEDQERIINILQTKNDRYAITGNAWQNVFPTNLRDYTDWRARVQAA